MMRLMRQTAAALWFLASFAPGVEQNPLVLIKTEIGDIKAEIYSAKAPATAANFLQYVDENRYEGACFYRVLRPDNQPNNAVKVEVIQGGLQMDERTKRLPPIPHETTEKTGVRHKAGTVSMARGNPGSAGSEFFICLNDQPELDFGGKRNPDGQGFAAFGKIVEGLDIVRKIQQMPADGQYLLRKIMIHNIFRVK